MYNTAMVRNSGGPQAIHASDFVPGAERAFCYLDGDDMYWREKTVRAFREAVPREWRDFNLKLLPSNWTAETLEEAAGAYSPIPGVPVVVIAGSAMPGTQPKKRGRAKKDAKEDPVSKADAARWERITNAGEDVMILVCEGNIPASVKKKFVAVNCSKPAPDVLSALAKKEAKPSGIEFRAVNLLIQFTDGRAMDIVNEAHKLRDYADGAEITVSDVEALVGDNMEHAIYELSNALADKDKPRAERLKDRFLSNGVEYTQLFWLLINQYRRLLHAALSPLTDAELAEKMGVKEIAVTINRRTAKKYTKANLKAILDLLVKAEADYRTGVCSDETAFGTAFAGILTI